VLGWQKEASEAEEEIETFQDVLSAAQKGPASASDARMKKAGVDPRGSGRAGGRQFTSSQSFFSGGNLGPGGGGGGAPTPRAVAAGLPIVQDPFKREDGKKAAKKPAKSSEPKKKVEDVADPRYAALKALEEEDDGQQHPPVRTPLAGPQRLYLAETVSSNIERAAPVQIGHEDTESISEDMCRQRALFNLDKEEDENDKLFFVQLPSTLPISSMMAPRDPALSRTAEGEVRVGLNSVEEDEIATSLDQQMGQNEWTGRLPDVEPGYMGKLRVHQSGKMVLVLGDVTYHVAAGTHCPFRQDVLIVNPQEETCHALGAVQDRLVCKLDPNSLLAPSGR